MTAGRCLRSARLVALIGLVASASLIATASAPSVAPSVAMNGTISGRVTSSTTGQGLANTTVRFYEEDADLLLYATTVDVNGFYSLNVPPGNYGVLTDNNQGHINEIYNNVQCSAVCDVNSITMLTVTTNSFTNIDFVLDPGGLVTGTVTDSTTGQPVANVTVQFVDPGGQVPFTKGVTNGAGFFQTEGGTAAGTVFAFTVNASGYRNEAFSNPPSNAYCDADCDPTAIGTAITVTNPGVTGNVDFALEPGGRVSGTVRDGNGVPLANIFVGVMDATFTNSAQGFTDASGQYTTGGLPAGTYYASTFNTLGYADQAWNGVFCPGSTCSPPFQGTPISVTVGGNTSGIDLTLVAGGEFTGSVTNAAGGAPIPLTAGGSTGIAVYNNLGTQLFLLSTDNNGVYDTPQLPPGTYYAQTVNVIGFGNQLYNTIPCGGCPVTTGTPIVVTAGNSLSNINFSLSASGTIAGTITNAAGGAPIANLGVQVFSSVGNFVGSVNTNGSGVYTIGGLAAGSYYVRTNGVNSVFMNEIYDNILCQQCTVTTSGGTLVTVFAGAPTGNIDFALAAGGRISGTVTNANGGAAISGLGAQIFNASGASAGQFNTNASGVYTTVGLPAGDYYVRTQNTLGFVNELYDDISCPITVCAPTSGTKVTVTGTATTMNIDFALVSGARISGQVTTAGGAPLANVNVQVYNTLNRLFGGVVTDNAGNYTTQALPDGTYFVRTANTVGYIDEVFDNIQCLQTCSPAGATPIVITGGVNQTGKNFALAQGGTIGGRVRDAGTLNPIQGSLVSVFGTNGVLLRTASTIVNGTYLITGLPAGNYHVRTVNQLGYKDKIYNNVPYCDPSCLVTDGAQVAVTVGNTTTGIDFDLVAGTEMLQNPGFSNGISSWQLFATLLNGNQDNSQLIWQVVNGQLQYYRTTASASGVFLQNSGVPVSQGQGVLAQWDFFNTSDTRKRISALIHDGDFSDLSVCTFWAPPNSGNRRYSMLTHPTKPWTNATISLYAASADTNGGFYQIDNVTLQTVTTPPDRTVCVDLHKPGIGTGPDGPELLTNRDFATNDTTNWTLFGGLTSQVSSGVFEFIRTSGGGLAGVILQSVGPGSAGQVYTARFDLGNSSNVRKRVTVLIHDNDFSDLHACTYWIEPNTALAHYVMQTYATEAWQNATLSVYAASVGPEQWSRLDDASLKKTPGAIINGTECFEPLSAPPDAGVPDAPANLLSARAPAGPIARAPSGGSDTVPVFALPDTGGTSLSISTRLTAELTNARIEVSLDGQTWQTLLVMPAYDDWLDVDLDLSEFAGQPVFIRFVADDPKGTWEIRWRN